MRTKRETITINSIHIENIIREYYQQLVQTNIIIQIKWTDSLKKINIPRLTQEVGNQNSILSIKESELSKTFPQRKLQAQLFHW